MVRVRVLAGDLWWAIPSHRHVNTRVGLGSLESFLAGKIGQILRLRAFILNICKLVIGELHFYPVDRTARLAADRLWLNVDSAVSAVQLTVHRAVAIYIII